MHRESRAYSVKKNNQRLLLVFIPLVIAALVTSGFIMATLKEQRLAQFHEVAGVYLDSIDLTLQTVQRQMSWSAMRDESFIALEKSEDLETIMDALALLRGQYNTLQQSTGMNFQFFFYIRGKDFFLNCSALKMNYGAYLRLKGELISALDEYPPRYEWSVIKSGGINYLYYIAPYENRFLICVTPLEMLIAPLSKLDLGPAGYVALADSLGRPLLNRPLPAENVYGDTLLNGTIGVYPVLDAYGSFGPLVLAQALTALLVLIVLCFLVTTTLMIHRRVLRPIRVFANNLASVDEGGDAIDLQSSSILELEQANDEFKKLIAQIRNLKIDIYERERERQKVQLEYLQLQIKPHFFLNCMTSIHSMAQMGLCDEIQAMAATTADYFRYIFQSGQDFVPLSGELAHARNYLEIQKLRYGDALSYEILTDDAVRDAKIPPLTLQTFIENTIAHAMSMDDVLHIAVSTHRDGERVWIEIADTGCGFSEDVLTALESGRSLGEQGRHIGIRNTLARLDLLFGGKAHVAFSNVPMGGARIVLTIPVERRGAA